MKIVKESELTDYSREFGFLNIFVDESVCNYYVTVIPDGYEFPIMLSWRVSKRKAKKPVDAFIYARKEYNNESKVSKRL